MIFLFFSSSLACLEPELELFEVWEINVRQIIIIANGINSQTSKLQTALARVLEKAFKKKKDIKRPFFPPCRNWPICAIVYAVWSSLNETAQTVKAVYCLLSISDCIFCLWFGLRRPSLIFIFHEEVCFAYKLLLYAGFAEWGARALSSSQAPNLGGKGMLRWPEYCPIFHFPLSVRPPFVTCPTSFLLN